MPEASPARRARWGAARLRACAIQDHCVLCPLAKDAKCATRKVSIPVLYLAVTALIKLGCRPFACNRSKNSGAI
jgi:hypothetical protein